MIEPDAPCQTARPVGESARVPLPGPRISDVDPHTGLASDFLNQFNEISMLLDIVADDPAFEPFLRAWRPVSYAEHFARSRLADTGAILEAYRLCPPLTRRRFDAASADLSRLIIDGLSALAQLSGDAAARARHDLAEAIRARVDALSAIIHPTGRAGGNAAISRIFAGVV